MLFQGTIRLLFKLENMFSFLVVNWNSVMIWGEASYMGFSWQEYWSSLPFPSPANHVLSGLIRRNMPFGCSMQLDDTPGTLAVPLLVLVEHVNVHLLPGVRQGAAWGPGQMPRWGRWIWVWANSRRQWSRGKPGMLQSMGSERVGHDLATEQQQSYMGEFSGQRSSSLVPLSASCLSA